MLTIVSKFVTVKNDTFFDYSPGSFVDVDHQVPSPKNSLRSRSPPLTLAVQHRFNLFTPSRSPLLPTHFIHSSCPLTQQLHQLIFIFFIFNFGDPHCLPSQVSFPGRNKSLVAIQAFLNPQFRNEQEPKPSPPRTNSRIKPALATYLCIRIRLRWSAR